MDRWLEMLSRHSCFTTRSVWSVMPSSTTRRQIQISSNGVGALLVTARPGPSAAQCVHHMASSSS